MRIVQSTFLSLFLFASVFPAAAQDPASATQPAPAPQALDQSQPPSAESQPASAPPTATPETPRKEAPPAQPSQPAAASLNDVVDRVVQREHLFLAQMRHMRPMVETYLQYLKDDKEGVTQPTKDQYFLGRLDMSDGPEDTSFTGQPGFGHRMVSHLTGIYAMHFLPLGFAQMVVLDTDFQRKYYDFSFVRREFLGELRCLVIDVQPKMGAYLHFDSWRLNLRPGTWLPAYIYSEESNLKTGLAKGLHFKAQTRLWGYDLHGLGKN